MFRKQALSFLQQAASELIYGPHNRLWARRRAQSKSGTPVEKWLQSVCPDDGRMRKREPQPEAWTPRALHPEPWTASDQRPLEAETGHYRLPISERMHIWAAPAVDPDSFSDIRLDKMI